MMVRYVLRLASLVLLRLQRLQVVLFYEASVLRVRGHTQLFLVHADDHVIEHFTRWTLRMQFRY